MIVHSRLAIPHWPRRILSPRLPERQRRIARTSLAAIFTGAEAAPKAERNRRIAAAHLDRGYTLAEISAMTDTGISTLHARLKAGRKRLDAALESASSPTSEEPR